MNTLKMHRTRTFLADIREKDAKWLRDNVPFQFTPLTEDVLENKTTEERSQLIISRLNALNSSLLVGYFADRFHPEVIPHELDFTLLTSWITKDLPPLTKEYSFPFE